MGRLLKILVLGHRGMLGRVVVSYLQSRCEEVVTVDERYEKGKGLITAARRMNVDAVINCVGRIPQKHTEGFAEVNSAFVGALVENLRPEQLLIHASTDCVFSGRDGPYAARAERDPKDEYGASKLTAECIVDVRPNSVIIRTSIVGLGSDAGLLGWLLSQSGRQVTGYTNHLWNGITTLQWTKIALEALYDPRDRLVQPGVWPPVSKYELLCAAAQHLEADVSVMPGVHPVAVNRALFPTVCCPPIEAQLIEMREFWSPRSTSA